MTTNLYAFIIVLGVLVFVHELGHFLVAKIFGVGIEKFSLGFGPKLVGKTIGRTNYRISAIPLGGYVKMVGEEPDVEMPPEDIPFSFNHKPLYQRFLIVAAGPISNLILAVLIFFGVLLYSGMFILQPTVGTVEPQSPADIAGIRSGDTVMAINGRSVDNWEDMSDTIMNSQGRPLSLTIERAGDRIDIQVIPTSRASKNIFGETIDRYAIGIVSSGAVITKPVTFVEALSESTAQTYKITVLTIKSIAKVIQGSLSPKTLGGPIMIAEIAGQQAREGAANLIFFIAVLSINLAILNFLPIPVLDGGHLLFFLIEAVIRRPVSLKVREIANRVGMSVLMMIMLLVFYNDLSRYADKFFQLF
jgi:regulator of sigma E protease